MPISFLTSFCSWPYHVHFLIFSMTTPFISLLPPCNSVKPRKTGKLEATISLTGWFVATSTRCQRSQNTHTGTIKITQPAPTELSPNYLPSVMPASIFTFNANYTANKSRHRIIQLTACQLECKPRFSHLFKKYLYYVLQALFQSLQQSEKEK